MPLLNEKGIDLDNLVVALFTLDGAGGVDKATLRERWDRVLEAAEALPGEELHRLLFLDGSEALVGFFSSDRDITLEAVQHQVQAVQQAAEAGAQATLSAGISNLCTEPGMLPQAYEQASCCARQSVFSGPGSIFAFRQLTTERPENLAYFDTDLLEKALLAQDYPTIRQEVDRVLNTFDTPMREYRYLDRMCLSVLFHVSLWGLRYGVSMEDVMRGMGTTYTDIYLRLRHPAEQAHLCAGPALCLPAGTGPPPGPGPCGGQRCHAGAGVCGRRILFQHPFPGERGRPCAQDPGLCIPGVQE